MEQRKSNMELLRIVSIFMIVIFHCAFKSGFSFEPGFSVNKLIVKCFWMLGELGVNLFMLISGYFMINGRFKWKKLIRLLAEAQFYYWLTVFISWRVGFGALPTGRSLFLAFFPVTVDRWWFLTVYILIYIFSPYLNILARAMDETTYRRFLLTALTLYCVIPTFFGFFFNTTESMLYYNRFIWLVIVYFTGAYIWIRGEEKSERFSRKYAVPLAAASAVVLVVSIPVIDRYSGLFGALGTTEPAYFWPPNTIPMLGLSIGIFALFLRLRIPYNPVINTVASATLGVYLLHDGVLAYYIWQTVFQCAAHQESPLLTVRMLAVCAVILAAGTAVDLLRQWLEKHTLGVLLGSDAAGLPSQKAKK